MWYINCVGATTVVKPPSYSLDFFVVVVFYCLASFEFIDHSDDEKTLIAYWILAEGTASHLFKGILKLSSSKILKR